MNTGEKIKKIREQLGLTLQDLADALDVSRPTIQRYETGEIKNLKQETIEKLSEVLHVSPSYLMGWDDDEANMVKEESAYYINSDAKKMAQEIYENPDLRVLFDATRKLSTDDIKAVVEIVNRLKGR